MGIWKNVRAGAAFMREYQQAAMETLPRWARVVRVGRRVFGMVGVDVEIHYKRTPPHVEPVSVSVPRAIQLQCSVADLPIPSWTFCRFISRRAAVSRWISAHSPGLAEATSSPGHLQESVPARVVRKLGPRARQSESCHPQRIDYAPGSRFG
jgi:hypothetical protein